MAVYQVSVATQNARLDAMETIAGQSPTLRIYSNATSLPANCAAAVPGGSVVLATINLPSDWMAPAANGSKAMSGSWTDNNADAAGTAAWWRLTDSGGVCHQQGDISASGGNGSLTIDNIVFAVGQAFTITSFTITDNNG